MIKNLDPFVLEVVREAYRRTGSKEWNDEVIDIFWNWDFDPSVWQDVYLEYVNNL